MVPQQSTQVQNHQNKVKICFGDDEAGGFVKLFLKSCLPR